MFCARYGIFEFSRDVYKGVHWVPRLWLTEPVPRVDQARQLGGRSGDRKIVKKTKSFNFFKKSYFGRISSENIPGGVLLVIWSFPDVVVGVS